MHEVMLHIPHSSSHIPAQWRDLFLLGDSELSRESLLMTDAFAAELFDLPGAARLVFPVSRLLVDPERFEDDEREPLPASAWGPCARSPTTAGR
jgi:hypothetical protein